MISILHQGTTRLLAPGSSWSIPGGTPDGAYRDAPESELLGLVREVESGRPWREAVGARYAATNPWLHRIVTDVSRDLFFRLHPPPADSLVLDVGAGWGQASLPLAAGNRVVALEPTPERLAFLRAAALQEGLGDRMCFVGARLQDLDFLTRFDLVCCIGVLEWVPRFAEGDPRALQVEFLRRLAACLAPGGRLVVAIENRLGLKYLLGARDDHTGLSGVSVLDRVLASRRHSGQTGRELRCLTYSLAEYDALFAEAGLRRTAAHAAWPDYKLPSRILPVAPGLDAALLASEFLPEHDGFSGSALSGALQEELASHYRSLAELGVAGAFAPSYFLEATCS